MRWNAVLCFVPAIGLTIESSPHGGRYRGGATNPPPMQPGELGPTPPGKNVSKGGGRQPGGAGPSSPSTAGGPGGGGGGGTGAGPTTGGPGGGGIAIGEDYTRWQYWWEFNKDRYLQLRDSLASGGTETVSDEVYMGAGKLRVGRSALRPTRQQIEQRIVPALVEALQDGDRRDITSSCMMALAQIGAQPEGTGLASLFCDRLKSADLEIRQVAALALGVSGDPEGLDDLIALTDAGDAGRARLDRASVDPWTRAFAIYGLGLLGRSSPSDPIQRRALASLRRILADGSTASRDAKVAAIQAIRVMRPKSERALTEAVSILEAFWALEFGPGEQIVQAHVPTVLADLARASGDAELIRRARAMCVSVVRGDREFRRMQVLQSAVLALGQIGDADDRETVDLLKRTHRNARDMQARWFALIALGQIGGGDARDFLLEVLRRGSKSLVKPWAALALGVHAREHAADGSDDTAGAAILEWFTKTKNPDAAAALAIGIGLTGHDDAIEPLRAALARYPHRDEFAGYVCVSLALLDAQVASPQIRELTEGSLRRPDRLRHAAIALGCLGDVAAVPLLTSMLRAENPTRSRVGAVSLALVQIGDRRAVDDMLQLLEDPKQNQYAQAYAASVLGGIAQRGALPWSEPIAANINYRANVSTLVNGASGVLDLL